MRFNPALFARAGRQLSVIFTLIIFLCLTGATVAFAQTVDAAPLTGATTASVSVLGWVLIALFGAACVAIGFASLKLSGFLDAKVKETAQNASLSAGNAAKAAGWNAVNIVWLKTQAIGSKVLGKEKALIEKILGDGKITHDEVVMLTNAILGDIRDAAASELPLIKDLIAGGTEGGLTTLLTGWASAAAHKLLGVTDSSPTASPTSAVPPPRPALVQAPEPASPT